MSLEYREDEPQTSGEMDAAEPAYVAPRPVYTIILILGIAAVFVAQLVTGIDVSAMRAGFDKQAFMHGHQYWRILTGATTHGSVLHIFMNCYAFYSFGRIV